MPTPATADRPHRRPARTVGARLGLTVMALLGLLLSSLWGAGVAGAATTPSTPEPTAGQPGQPGQPAVSVFSGVVEEISSAPRAGGGPGALVFSVQVNRLYTGDVETSLVSVRGTQDFQRCPVSALATGQSYVFSLADRQGELVADLCSDVRVATTASLRDVRREYGSGRLLRQEAPAPADLELGEPLLSEPTAISRQAAPGVALVIVALLGLVVVRRLARRS